MTNATTTTARYYVAKQAQLGGQFLYWNVVRRNIEMGPKWDANVASFGVVLPDAEQMATALAETLNGG